MINTAILLLSLSGDIVYEAEMPTMKECLTARTEITQQKSSFKTVCIPVVPPKAKVCPSLWEQKYEKEWNKEWPKNFYTPIR